MKKIRIEAIPVTVFALVLAVGSLTLLHPCVHADGSAAPCAGVQPLLLIISAASAVIGVLPCFLRKGGLQALSFALAGIGGVLCALTPGVLTPVCGMDTMRCRMVTQPAARILGILIAICAVIGCLRILLARRGRGGRA